MAADTAIASSQILLHVQQPCQPEIGCCCSFSDAYKQLDSVASELMSHWSQIQQNLRFCTQIPQMMTDVIRFKGSTMESTMDLSLRNATALRLSPKLGSLKPCSRSTILFNKTLGALQSRRSIMEKKKGTPLWLGASLGALQVGSHMVAWQAPCFHAMMHGCLNTCPVML